ncbi:MAG: DUF1838 family protein, partial [Cellulomonas iranensis]|uniref:DUF1838 family protein n=1 Tax=Cellulomonas iranensis TaxID=76862 RepID=UPI001B1D0937
ISDKVPEPPSYGGLQKVKVEPKPFLMDWMEGPEGTLILNTDIDMIYPNALQPDKWPRESSGVMNRVSEHFIYTVKREDVLNPNLTHIPHIGAWTRMTPWLPWMLMGQAPGHITYFTTFQTLPGGIKELPLNLVEAARAMDEKWLHSPTEDYGPSLSSLENYAREQKPAPVPAGWTPPEPPPAPPYAPGVGLRAELVRLGVPVRLLDAGPMTLGAVLGRLPAPPPPPRGVGQVLVVVGEGDGPRAVARTLAVRWGLPDGRVHELDASGAVTAPARDGGTAQVVALRVGTEHHDRARAAHALAGLGADQVWAVTDARTKSADVAAWVAAVGAERPVDALAVHGLLDTAAPGTVLEPGLPVAWVDGVPASRLVWAAALGQELDAALA